MPFPHKFGWIPDLPDARDYTKDTPKVKEMLLKQKIPASLPAFVDLRAFCPPIFDQGMLGSCTAQAAAALLEYWRKKVYGKDGPLSRLFIYKGTRDLMMAKGDSGAYIRTTMGCLSLLGAPPEKYWEYDEKLLDSAPPAFCYAYAANYQALSYYRIDTNKGELATQVPRLGSSVSQPAPFLSDIKTALSSGLPAMFGFRVYQSIESAQDGKIPFPSDNEKILGGHAVLCVGYDDNMQIGSHRGAFLIRNSWGSGWGELGYGWLPYSYLLSGLSEDWWVLIKAEWIDTEIFGI